MLYNILAVFIGGGIGAVLRYLISYISKLFFYLPLFGTLFVNLLGSFLIGCVLGLTLVKAQTFHPLLRVLITVGFLGGLTTFSTFSLEGFELIKDGKIGIAFLYIAGSCILSLLLVYLGYSITKS